MDRGACLLKDVSFLQKHSIMNQLYHETLIGNVEVQWDRLNNIYIIYMHANIIRQKPTSFIYFLFTIRLRRKHRSCPTISSIHHAYYPTKVDFYWENMPLLEISRMTTSVMTKKIECHISRSRWWSLMSQQRMLTAINNNPTNQLLDSNPTQQSYIGT